MPSFLRFCFYPSERGWRHGKPAVHLFQKSSCDTGKKAVTTATGQHCDPLTAPLESAGFWTVFTREQFRPPAAPGLQLSSALGNIIKATSLIFLYKFCIIILGQSVDRERACAFARRFSGNWHSSQWPKFQN